VKGLANLTKARSPVMPELPTAFEQGADVQAYSWTALFLPKHTPDEIVQTLNKAVVQARCQKAGPRFERRRKSSASSEGEAIPGQNLPVSRR
jgi:tripartite-type tricarboxylate transporter receptor subunit TctC